MASLYNFPVPLDLRELAAISSVVYYVYIQYRPDKTPFYVGKGFIKNGKTYRYCQKHVGNLHYSRVVSCYGELSIQTTILAVDNNKQACQWERELIYLLRGQGYKLTNKTDGGEGTLGYKHTEETKALIGWQASQYKMTDYHRQMLSEKTKGHPYYPVKTPEAAARQKNSRRGVKNTTEHNAKISASKLGHSVDQQTRLKIGAANKAKAREKQNRLILETPWGPMGMAAAADKIGISYYCLKKRVKCRVSPDRLFNSGRNKGGKRLL